MSHPCVIYVANRGFALAGSRLLLIKAFLRQNWKVVIATANDVHARDLVSLGAILEEVKFSRGGINPVADLVAYRKLHGIYRAYHPRLIHHFHAKPVIFGSLAAGNMTQSGVSIVNTITGLGHAFVANGVYRWLAGAGYRLTVNKSDATIFQNRDDRDLFLKSGWIGEDKAKLIVSSGVDITRFRPAQRKKGAGGLVTVAMVTRLLWKKGVGEYIQVARKIKALMPNVQFLLAGEFDQQHPDAISPASLESITSDGAVEFLGYVADIESVLSEADIFMFPSYYREGVPRVVIEAAACGLPTVAADVPGTREAVMEGVTGILVEPKNVTALTDAVARLISDEVTRAQMGAGARKMVEERFNIDAIVRRQLDVYRFSGVDISV